MMVLCCTCVSGLGMETVLTVVFALAPPEMASYAMVPTTGKWSREMDREEMAMVGRSASEISTSIFLFFFQQNTSSLVVSEHSVFIVYPY